MDPERVPHDVESPESATTPEPIAASEPSRGSSELLESVADRLRDLEQAANSAASELRRQLVLSQGERPPQTSSDRIAGAVLHELMLTLSERADGLEYEAELIAGILERASAAIERPPGPRRPEGAAQRIAPGGVRAPGERPQRPALKPRRPGAARTVSRKSRNGGSATAGVKLLAAQMALEGHSQEAIQGRLRKEFGIDDAAGAVEEVLGREKGA